ncbi:hypothetical protein ACFL16_01825 [Patescibacteria group bacterium]
MRKNLGTALGLLILFAVAVGVYWYQHNIKIQNAEIARRVLYSEKTQVFELMEDFRLIDGRFVIPAGEKVRKLENCYVFVLDATPPRYWDLGSHEVAEPYSFPPEHTNLLVFNVEDEPGKAPMINEGDPFAANFISTR